MFPTPASPHGRKTPGLLLCAGCRGLFPVQPAAGLPCTGTGRAEVLTDALGKGLHGATALSRAGQTSQHPEGGVRGRPGGGDTVGAWTARLGRGACIRRSWGPCRPRWGYYGRGRPGLACRGAGIGVLGLRDGVLPRGPESGREDTAGTLACMGWGGPRFPVFTAPFLGFPLSLELHGT